MIEVRNVTKRFGKHKALDQVNFTIHKGEMVGFLGANGAGKSTTMNIITGYLSITEGTVTVEGMNVLEHPREIKKKIGYLPEIPPLYMDMTVYEYLQFSCELKQVKKSHIKQEIQRITGLTKIEHVKKRLIQNLSKGYRQRVGLAAALVGDPEILILDEPTAGLDPKQIIDIRHLIQTLSRNKTIIISTHILAEISHICHKVLIMNEGKIIASDTVDALSERMNSHHTIQLRLKVEKRMNGEIIRMLSSIEGIQEVIPQGRKEKGTMDYTIVAHEGQDIRLAVHNACVERHYPVLELKSMELSLEDIFIKMITEQERLSC